MAALDRLPSPWPQGLGSDLKEVGVALNDGDGDRLILGIHKVTTKYATLHEMYYEERDKWAESLGLQHRLKAGVPKEDEDDAAELGVLDNKLPRFGRILTADDPEAAVGEEKEKQGENWWEAIARVIL